MTVFKKILYALVFLLVAAVVATFHYYLPRTEKVNVVGTEVKWTDESKLTAAQDVRYIFTKRYDSHKALVFRNEDMPWPPYFKFDSGDLSGQAVALEKTTPPPVALITYYGWRIPFLSMYPNATHLEVVAADYQHIPWFNIVFLVGLAILLFWLWFKTKRVIRQWKMKKTTAK